MRVSRGQQYFPPHPLPFPYFHSDGQNATNCIFRLRQKALKMFLLSARLVRIFQFPGYHLSSPSPSQCLNKNKKEDSLLLQLPDRELICNSAVLGNFADCCTHTHTPSLPLSPITTWPNVLTQKGKSSSAGRDQGFQHLASSQILPRSHNQVMWAIALSHCCPPAPDIKWHIVFVCRGYIWLAALSPACCWPNPGTQPLLPPG